MALLSVLARVMVLVGMFQSWALLLAVGRMMSRQALRARTSQVCIRLLHVDAWQNSIVMVAVAVADVCLFCLLMAYSKSHGS